MSKRCRKIAVILEDTLRNLGLQSLLADYFHPVEIDPYAGFGEFEAFGAGINEPYDYYFLSPKCYGLHAERFLPFRNQVILVTAQHPTDCPGHIDTSLPHEKLVEKIAAIFAGREKQADAHPDPGKEITQREIEVLRMIVRGRINKEIAEELSIGFQTVLSHRKNLTAKLGIKTVSGLTFYALTYGYVTPEEIGR